MLFKGNSSFLWLKVCVEKKVNPMLKERTFDEVWQGEAATN